MFRALLWKEWRELWMWPVISAAYVPLVFLVGYPMNRALPGEVWGEAFFPWLLVVGILIPTFLYTGETEAHTSQFLLSKPLDRFRLWWWKLLIGLMIMVVASLVVYVTTDALSRLYLKTATFESARTKAVWLCVCFSLFLYGLSSLTSALFKRRATAIVVSGLFLILMYSLWFVASYKTGPLMGLREIMSDDMRLSGVRFLTLCPILLFASLAAFARRSLWRQTRKTLVLGYAVAAIALLTPGIAGASYILSGIRDAQEQREDKQTGWSIREVFDDGNRVLVTSHEGKRLVSVDLSERSAHVIDSNTDYYKGADSDGDALAYVKRRKGFFPYSELLVSDFSGKKTKRLFRSKFASFMNTPNALWSMDGSLIAMTGGGGNRIGDEAFVSIFDRSGTLVGKHTFRSLEGARLYPIGWDAEFRFYFFKEVEKVGQTHTAYWRISRDELVPEGVPFLPGGEISWVQMSPNGRWMMIRSRRSRNENMKMRLVDIASEKEFLVSDNVTSRRWSRDGKSLIFIEKIENHGSVESQEDVSTRLMIFDFAAREKRIVPVDNPPVRGILSIWSYSSPTDTFWIVTKDEYLIFSSEAKQLGRLPTRGSPGTPIHWAKDDRLLWQSGNRLITTRHDGSNAKEVFRIEGDKFYLYGEEQS